MRYPCRLLLMGLLAAVLWNIPLLAEAQSARLQISVGELGQKTASFSVGEKHRWFLLADIPTNWEETEGISVLQTLSPCLELDTQSISARVLKENGEQTLLRMEEHLQVSAGSVFVEDGIADRFRVSLTTEGKDILSEYAGTQARLLIRYDAQIRTTASVGAQIIGSAQLDVTGTDGKRTIILSDKAVAATGGFHVALAAPDGSALSQERFMLAREATQEEREDPMVLTELLDTGEKTIQVVYTQFFTSETMEGEKTDIALTDKDGRACLYGLSYGVYYLVQMESIHEDMLASEPVQVRVNAVSHLTAKDGWKDSKGKPVDNTVRVTDTLLVMPQSGGLGTMPYTACGMAVILCACLLLWYNKKKTLAV